MKITIYLILCLILVTGTTGIIFAQDLPPIPFNPEIKLSNLKPDLAEEQKMLWLAYSTDPDRIGKVWVAHVNATVEEIVTGTGLPERDPSQSTVGGTVKNTISWFGDKLKEAFGEAWIEKAEKKAEKLKDVSHSSYVTAYDYTEDVQYQINIDSPYLSPVTLEVYEGTYITVTEYLVAEADKRKKADLEETLGEEISLNNELPIEYLQGEWIIKERELKSKYATQVPNVTITIKEYVGSIKEAEIDAERFLFSGEIQVEDKVYKAYTELDPVNIYADPSSFISILKEEGAEPVFAVMVIDMDSDYELFIDSDLELVYEKAFTIEIDSSVNDEYYQTDEDEVDYLVRK